MNSIHRDKATEVGRRNHVQEVQTTQTVISKSIASESVLMSLNLTGSLGSLVLSAVIFTVAMTTRNWFSDGVTAKMGLWDFCTAFPENGTWSCFSINADISVAVQAFSALACLCHGAMFVLFILILVSRALQSFRPLILAAGLLAFSAACLQIMTLVVCGVKHGDILNKIKRNDIPVDGAQGLYLSWSFYLAMVSTLFVTVSGALLLAEFKTLTFEAILLDP